MQIDSGMRVFYCEIKDDAAWQKLQVEQEKEGYRVAAISNTGLHGTGQVRVTFIPASEFKDAEGNGHD
ncbi:hypothetical protein ACN6KF_003009 [Labrys sp. La1]|uniref:hypothetical protein n=1 Tax=Labrys sp. La1 TaxID=3404917 RepID=UPI003EB97C9E